MNKKFFTLSLFEYLTQNKVHNLTRYLFSFFITFVIIAALINHESDIKKFGLIFFVIYLPLSLMSYSNIVINHDLDDGNLELLLVSFTHLEIILAKYLAFCLNSLISLALSLPIVWVIFEIQSLSFFLILCYCLILLIVLSNAILILIGTLQSYFMANTNFLAMLILLIIIPSLIIIGLILQDSTNINLLYILLGINLILIPILIFLATYLLQNIYHTGY